MLSGLCGDVSRTSRERVKDYISKVKQGHRLKARTFISSEQGSSEPGSKARSKEVPELDTSGEKLPERRIIQSYPREREVTQEVFKVQTSERWRQR